MSDLRALARAIRKALTGVTAGRLRAGTADDYGVGAVLHDPIRPPVFLNLVDGKPSDAAAIVALHNNAETLLRCLDFAASLGEDLEGLRHRHSYCSSTLGDYPCDCGATEKNERMDTLAAELAAIREGAAHE